MPVPAPALLPAEVTEAGWRFRSCLPVSFRGQRNTEKSPHFGPLFGQDLEPAGRYLITRVYEGELTRGWEPLDVHFACPLVLKLVPDDAERIYGPLGWKARLVAHYRKTGLALSRALVREGYDGIVTVGVDEQGRPIDTREIVDLRTLEARAAPRRR